jgi:phage tail P2-like protein
MSSLLPPNSSPQERAIEQSAARLGSVDVPVGKLWDPRSCPASLLPWLAWALSVDTWDAAWSEPVKRQVIADSLAIHARKGTPWAVARAMAAAGAPSLEMSEWFDNGGAPFTFQVCVSTSDQPLQPALADRLMADIAQYKNVRSWGSLRINQTGNLALSLAMAPAYLPVITVLPYQIEITTTETPICAAVGVKLIFNPLTI